MRAGGEGADTLIGAGEMLGIGPLENFRMRGCEKRIGKLRKSLDGLIELG